MFFIIFICISVKSARPGKRVTLLENEIAYLCQKSRQIFLSQPVLLELEAPIKVCGKLEERFVFGLLNRF